MPFGLRPDVLEKICAVFSQHPEVSQAVLYGSRAKGNFKPYSDIDIALNGDNLTLMVKGKIEDEIDDLLLPYKMDLVLFKYITNDNLLAHIKRVGQSIYHV
ncbi:MAG: nucleotidyltransferase domain-containing protein [Treponema sp.]|jgi:predicted nucleotidyltransferase|nr:nucleotidyltransferase domain-containing protein [Treponema sp.]